MGLKLHRKLQNCKWLYNVNRWFVEPNIRTYFLFFKIQQICGGCYIMNSINFMCKFKSILDDSYRAHVQIDKEASKARNAIKERRQSLRDKIASAEQKRKEIIDSLKAEKTKKLGELFNYNDEYDTSDEISDRITVLQKKLTTLENDRRILLLKVDNNVNSKKRIIDKIIKFIKCESAYTADDNFIGLLSPKSKFKVQSLDYLSYYNEVMNYSEKEFETLVYEINKVYENHRAKNSILKIVL